MRPAWEVSSVGRHRAGKRHTGTGAETQDFCSLLRYYVFIAMAAKSGRPLNHVFVRYTRWHRRKQLREPALPAARGASGQSPLQTARSTLRGCKTKISPAT